MAKLESDIFRAFGLQSDPQRTRTSLGLTGRTEMLDLWSTLDADQQKGLLIAARRMARRNVEDGRDGPALGEAECRRTANWRR